MNARALNQLLKTCPGSAEVVVTDEMRPDLGEYAIDRLEVDEQGRVIIYVR